jgi:8-oxo-dGTP pyrophosphatase MutT (NUDIX family)
MTRDRTPRREPVVQPVVHSHPSMTRVPRDVSVHVYAWAPDGLRLLMLRRTPERGGFWQGVTGAPLAGETDFDAAIREVREETGLDVAESLRPLSVTFAYALRPELADRWATIYGAGVAAVSVVCFGAEIASATDQLLDQGEHDAFQWCDYETALGLLEWPIEQDALPGRRRALRVLAQSAADR